MHLANENGTLQAAESPSVASSDPRRMNPLGELIATEGRYVQVLGMIIRRVAAAWNPSNFPPPELDAMFRKVEVVFRVNSEFLRSLREIGPNPSSPKGLGNLLMQWVGQMSGPYQAYISVYVAGMDTWPPVARNPKLPRVLERVSAELAQQGAPGPWTLDTLFALPLSRVRFYKKLYSRLLRSTQPGRSDHTLLQEANERLDALLEHARQREGMRVGAPAPVPQARPAANAPAVSAAAPNPAPGPALGPGRPAPGPTQLPPLGPAQHPLSGPPGAAVHTPHTPFAAHSPRPQAPPVRPSDMPPPGADATPAPVALGGFRPPGPFPLAPRAAEHASPSAITASIESSSLQQIQDRINSTQTLDVFTMQPKSCRLQICPPGLPFERMLRVTDGAHLTVVPQGAPPLTIKRARLLLLTDLLLVSEEKPERAPKDIQLLFPPLAGRFVEVAERGAAQDHALTLSIMRRVDIHVYLPNQQRKQLWERELAACRMHGAPPPKPAPPQAPSSLGLSGVSGPAAGAPPTAVPGGAPTQALALGGPGSRPPNAPGAAGRADQPKAPSGSSSELLSALGTVGTSAPRPLEAVPLGPPSGTVPRPPRPQPGSAPSSPTVHRPQLPPLLQPYGQAAAPLPPMPIAEQDAGRMGSPATASATLTRDNSLSSMDSFARPPRMRMDSPEMRLQSPLSRSPPKLRRADDSASSPTLAGFSLPPPRPPLPGGERRSSDRASPQQSMRFGPRRSASQPRLQAVGRAVPPSQMLQEGGRQRSPEWMAQLDDDERPRAATEMDQRHPTFHLCAQMRCKVFVKQSYAQWKSLGAGRLRLYRLFPSCANQLVVENDKKLLISSIILPIGVERVSKAGLAIELSDEGRLTGIVYMLHMRSEESANGLFQQLLEGSSRSVLSSPTPE